MAPKNRWREHPAELLRVGEGFSLADVDPRATPGWGGTKQQGKALGKARGPLLSELQERLYAHGRTGGSRSVLLVVQGMDTSGKGGVVRHVMGMVDPQGVALRAFGRPTEEEARHHYLWRVRRALPTGGQIGVFDRSHYEDVLIQRVREMAPPEEIERRYDAIVDFEREMASRNVRIIKVMLHISKGFQKENLIDRLENPDKHWKFEPGDLDERELWDEYQEAYEIAMKRTSTDFAPWYCIPGDRKKYARMAVKYLVLDALRSMNMTWPPADFNVELELERAKRS